MNFKVSQVVKTVLKGQKHTHWYELCFTKSSVIEISNWLHFSSSQRNSGTLRMIRRTLSIASLARYSSHRGASVPLYNCSTASRLTHMCRCCDAGRPFKLSLNQRNDTLGVSSCFITTVPIQCLKSPDLPGQSFSGDLLPVLARTAKFGLLTSSDKWLLTAGLNIVT